MPRKKVKPKKRRVPKRISQKYKDRLQMKDFLGQLTEAEVQVAREHGLLRWDLWKKAQRIVTLTGDLHRKGFRLSPVFGKKYQKNQKFLVCDYSDLERQKSQK